MNKTSSTEALHENTKIDGNAPKMIAKAAIDPSISAMRAISSIQGGKVFDHDLDSGELLHALDQRLDTVKMIDTEAMLMGQAIALQSLFVHLIERGKSQSQMQHFEAFLKLALRAQNQSRATLETLSNIKNPPVVFAKQANISTGAQQINNGLAPQTHARARAREREIQTEPNELLEQTQHEQRMDTRASRKTSRANQNLETMDEIDGGKNSRRKNHIKSEQL